MSFKNNQKGFAHIIILLVVVLVAVVGFTAYRVVSSNSGDEAYSDLASKQQPEATESTDQTTTETQNKSQEESTDTSTNESGSDTNTETSSNTQASTEAPSSGGTSSGGSSGGSSEEPAPTKSFNVDAFSFGYSSSTLNVSPGDVVTINLTNSGGKHDWVVDEISGAATAIINGGQTDSITFTVPQSAAGKTYNFYCSVGNHRALGMQGDLVVSS